MQKYNTLYITFPGSAYNIERKELTIPSPIAPFPELESIEVIVLHIGDKKLKFQKSKTQ